MRIYFYLGFFFVGLGSVGLFLPVVPTTPFLLLAAGCFAKSSRKWHNWLLHNPTFGPIIHNWETRRCLTLRTKIISLSSILIFGGLSVIKLPNIYGQILCILFLAYGFFYVLRIDLCQRD